MLLHNSLIENENDRLRFYARIHGVDVDSTEDSETEIPVQSEKTENKQFLFRDPKDYSDLTAEERQKMTENALKYWKNWAGSGKHGLGGDN